MQLSDIENNKTFSVQS